ncbi:MAG: FAD-dependent oxidoreductase [Actinobacteria bacterium]|nr:FAD-dependent oxidoreductase [Actinomycetota bacterium]MBV8959680.1 FAD-dependent oxidoreductase [Actinomycetota bacterium]MBV9254369.1 FAD-dependent oxidoreductase [Actinomycetota bacterium]MBV9662965.1 FAD-dependent oxidoreductase [Actinomycetota bacterium]
MAVRFTIIGGGPAGVQAATHAARLGAEVTMIERDIVGGAAQLLDCIPSKAMIATGGLMSASRRAAVMGLHPIEATLDFDAVRTRIHDIEAGLTISATELLASQGVRLLNGTGTMKGPHEVVAEVEGEMIEVEADAVLVSTGSRPRVPDWAEVDGERVLTTRQAYPPPELPSHLVVIGSGVTGVEFVHMFTSFGSQVTLVVSRQQVLPQKDPEVAAVLEDNFLQRGVKLLKGARAQGITRDGDEVVVACDDGRSARGSHVLLAIGSIPNTEALGLDAAGVTVDQGGYVPINQHCQSNVPHIYAAGDVSGRLPLASVAFMQGRKVAEHVMGLHTRQHRHLDYDKAASAIFTEPEIADVGLAEADAFAIGRKIRVTKVPFAVNARALIDGDPRGFVKIVSDPATGVVLGGSIVGQGASELISVLALAVTANLKVTDIVESLLVHPALAEALADAAE